MKITTLRTCIAATLCLVVCSFAEAQLQIRAGSNTNLRPTLIEVPFNDGWKIDLPLKFDPDAPPIEKVFNTPPEGIPPNTGFPVWEEFPLTDDSQPVADWHEEIFLSPGWIWRLLPDDPLITINGQPHNSSPPDLTDPTKLWVDFEPIHPPNVLDIHKELFYVGNDFDEDGTIDPWPGTRNIRVREYPTPEPGSLTLALFGIIGLLAAARRQR